MKKIIAVFMAAVMLIMLCSCGSNAAEQDSKSADDNGQTEVRLEETEAAEKSDISDTEGIDTGNPSAVPMPEQGGGQPGGGNMAL